MTTHQLTRRDGGYHQCDVCGLQWWKEPQSDCLGVKVYKWGKWDENLLTKKQMADAGFQVGRKLPPPAGAVYRDKSPGGVMWLYARDQGVPKSQPTDAQRAALAKAQEALQRGWHCAECGTRLERHLQNEGVCDQCEIVRWVRETLAAPFVIFDTETTGLHRAEFVQVAVIDSAGNPLVNTLVKPRHPERLLEYGDNDICAADINGIRPEMLTDAPTFEQVYPSLFAALNGNVCIVYNVDFDIPLLEAACKRAGVPIPECTYYDAMLWYAQWYGEWSRYWGNYKWQQLPGGDHTAAGDCLAVLKLLKSMARQAEPQQATEMQSSESEG
jgi:DNA polymerase III subunit epsilon